MCGSPRMCTVTRLCIHSLWMLLFLSGFKQTTAQLDNVFRIASLYMPQYESEGLELAMHNAINHINLKEMAGPGIKIVMDKEYLNTDNSFDAHKEVCRMMKGKIAAIFGPVSEASRGYIQSLSQAFQVPYMQAVWDPNPTHEDFTINIYPQHERIGKAHADLIKHWGWTQFTVIYEDNNSLLRLQTILETARGEEYKMSVRQIEMFQDQYTSMLKDMMEKHQYRIVIDCQVERIPQILKQADSLNMITPYFHFHFTTLDLSLVDLDKYRYTGVNITSMRLIKRSNPHVQDVMTRWSMIEANIGKSPFLGNTRYIKTETALLYDAVNVFAKALNDASKSRRLNTQILNCNKPEVNWADGDSLLNALRAVNYNGLSGNIQFEKGRRKDFDLEIIRLTQDGLVEVGTTSEKKGIDITVTVKKQKFDELEMLKNTTLRVVTLMDPPYVMPKEPGEDGRTVEGFIIDLLDELSASLGFNYTIYEQVNRAYGSEDKNGKWNGMIGDLIERDAKNKADLAAAGLTITYERANVVDFTMPFLNLGITIIYQKPTKSPPDLFSFLLPLSPDVWIYMIAAYLCVSFMLFVIARFTPYEWENPHPCDQESEEVENQFTILNSLWFTIGSLMQQGSDIAPKALSSRWVASVWYLFTLILVSSYTANLAAWLTVRRMDSPIKNANDLSQQTEISYGTLNQGSSRDFFKNSNDTTFKRMNAYMSANEERVMVQSNADGFNRVKESNYAYIGESTTIDYQVQRNCDLQQVGDWLDSKGYGMAAPKDAYWLKYISQEIVHLRQKQIISKIYTKWWVEKSNIKCVDDEKDKDKVNSNALGVRNVGGVFVVLAGGSVFAFLVAILEFLWKVGRNAKKDKQSFWSEMSEELSFIIRCKSTRNLGKAPSEERVDNNGVRYSPANMRANDINHRDT